MHTNHTTAPQSFPTHSYFLTIFISKWSKKIACISTQMIEPIAMSHFILKAKQEEKWQISVMDACTAFHGIVSNQSQLSQHLKHSIKYCQLMLHRLLQAAHPLSLLGLRSQGQGYTTIEAQKEAVAGLQKEFWLRK